MREGEHNVSEREGAASRVAGESLRASHSAELVADGVFASDLPEAQLLAWISSSLRVALAAADGDARALGSLWIKLFGVFAEVADFVSVRAAGVRPCDALFPAARGLPDWSAVELALAALRACFDQEELLYLEHRRELEVHAFQSAVRAARRPLGARPRLACSSLLGGREVRTEDAESAFQRLLWKYALREEQIGFDFARRSIPHLRALEQAVRACIQSP